MYLLLKNCSSNVHMVMQTNQTVNLGGMLRAPVKIWFTTVSPLLHTHDRERRRCRLSFHPILGMEYVNNDQIMRPSDAAQLIVP